MCINEFLEFYDEFEENYYSINATLNYMWREENCPNIFKIKIDRESLEIKKEVAFKKLNIGLNNTKH